jgi:archaellum biogenesis ATPase FlaH
MLSLAPSFPRVKHRLVTLKESNFNVSFVARISFVMSVCLSVRTEQLGSQWTDFHVI